MSWFKKNYDKAVMGLAFLGLGGAVAASFMGGTTPDASTKTGKENATFPWEGLAATLKGKTEQLQSSQAATKVWQPVKINNTQTAYLLQGPPLVQKANSEDVVDALDPAAEPLRPPVANEWLIRYGLDITRSDVLKLDQDGDKFSNLEESLGDSNPRDPNSTPSAVLKLKLVEVVALKCELKFTSSGTEFNARRVREDAPGQESTKSKLNWKIGEAMEADGRFVLESVGDETADGKTVKVAKIKDAVITEGSPFSIKDGEMLNRPTLQAKLSCDLDGREESTGKMGDQLSFKAFPTIQFKLVKIDQAANTVEVEYSEAGKPSKTHQIKKD
jgi:hypothetical protein